MPIAKTTLLFLLYAACLASCHGPKKISSTKTKLSAIDSQLLDNQKKLKELNSQRAKKQRRNELDDTSGERIGKYIDNANNEIQVLINKNSVQIGNTVVSRSDWDQLKKSLNFSAKTLKLLGKKVLMLSDLINRNAVVRLDQDVVFAPGQYTVEPALADTLSKLFQPAAKEINQFIQKYPDFPLSIVITARGYADGTSIGEGTQLYTDLVARLKLRSGTPDSRDLNKELSNARAEAVILIFKKVSASQASNGYNLSNVLYIYEGKGDSFPDPSVQDYKTDDPRRRVVLLFWSLFPE